MTAVVPLAEAHDTARFGAKAVGLGDAARAGLPVPPGIALSGPMVDEVAAGHEDAIRAVIAAAKPLASSTRLLLTRPYTQHRGTEDTEGTEGTEVWIASSPGRLSVRQ